MPDRRPLAALVLPLRGVLVVPFVLQICATVGLVGWLSFRNGQAAVEQVAANLREDIADRVRERLQDYMARPQRATAATATALAAAPDLATSPDRLEALLLDQLRAFPDIRNLYFGSIDGEFAGAQRPATGPIAPIGTDWPAPDEPLPALPGEPLNPEFAHRRPPYDPRDRPWYRAAIAAREPTWGRVYADFGVSTYAITASRPLYDGEGRLLGVVGSDFFLSEVSRFLQRLEVGRTGETFLVEPDGSLLAASVSGPLFRLRGQTLERLPARDSANAAIREVSRALEARLGSFAVDRPQALDLRWGGRRYFVQVEPLRDGWGLDWAIVVVLPEADFMDRIHRNTRVTLALCAAALAIAVALGVWICHRLSRTIAQFGQAAGAVAAGDFRRSLPRSRVRELAALGDAFAAMARQLDAAFAALERSRAELEARVRSRTAELEAANRELARLARSDGLTQLANRREFEACLDREWQRLQRLQRPLGLILCDVDEFKRYNDTYGHPAGDRCLAAIAGALRAVAQRPADLVARYGGEEFVLVLPETDRSGAERVAVRVLAAVAGLNLAHGDTTTGRDRVTVSLGVACWVPRPSRQPEALVRAADVALYAAKRAGRNCYCCEPGDRAC